MEWRDGHRWSLSIIPNFSTVSGLGIRAKKGVRFTSGIFQHLSSFQCSTKREDKGKLNYTETKSAVCLAGLDRIIKKQLLAVKCFLPVFFL